MMEIAPYRLNRTWVFDDLSRDLIEEPFVDGADRIIDKMLLEARITSAFRLRFDSKPFHDARFVLRRVKHSQRGDDGGAWYLLPSTTGEETVTGWLCPALLKYFETPPSQLFVTVVPVNR